MTEPNTFIKAARAHLERADRPTFVDDTMRGLLEEIERLKAENLPQSDKDQILHRMVEGLHALVFGTYSIQSGDYALKSLGDGGEIHEYVHAMVRLLPPRHLEQVQSGGEPAGE